MVLWNECEIYEENLEQEGLFSLFSLFTRPSPVSHKTPLKEKCRNSRKNKVRTMKRKGTWESVAD